MDEQRQATFDGASRRDAGGETAAAAATTERDGRPEARVGVLVLGMHRSGTSAFTRLLNLLGGDLPGGLMLPVPGNNETGFWESEEIASIHDEILAAAGSRWDEPTRLSAGWFETESARRFRERLRQVVERELPDSRFFVLKDPRLCRLVPLWMGLLGELGVEPRFLLPVRHPLEVAASLGKRDGISTRRAVLVWLRHVLDAEAATRGRPRLIATYDSLLTDWRQLVRRIDECLELPWSPATEEAASEVDRFLHTRLRHHRAAPAELDGRDDLVPWIRTAWRALADADGRAGEELPSELDPLRRQLDQADGAFGPLLAEGREELIHARHRRDVAEEAAGASERLQRHLERQGERLAADLADKARESEARAGEIERLQERLEDRELEAEARAAEIERLQDRLEDRELEAQRLRRSAELARRESRRLATELARGAGEHRARRAEGPDMVPGDGGDERPGSKATRKRGGRSSTLRLLVRRPGLLRRLRGLRRRVVASGLFDPEYYARQFGEEGAPRDPLLHYLTLGGWEGRDPHPLFSSSYYLRQNRDVASRGAHPLAHYLDYGCREGRRPHLLFDPPYYLSQFPDLAESGVDPLGHFLREGAAEGIHPHPLFDLDHYRQVCGPTLDPQTNPLIHYLRVAGRDGRSPHPLFDLEHYLEQSPEVLEDQADPLLHYLSEGVDLGRSPHPLFDPAYYLRQRPELAGGPALGILFHFLLEGGSRGLDPHPLFDSAYYLRNHPELRQRGINPLVHYLTRGGSRGGNPNPLFDSAFYLQSHPHVADRGLNPLQHYVRAGAAEGREPGPLFSSVYYRQENGDLSEMQDPLEHFLRHGADQGRVGWSPARAQRFIRPYILRPEGSSASTYLEREATVAPERLRVGVYCSAQGNYFFGEIADLVVAGLRGAGVEVVELDERSEHPDDLSWEIVVAPHEFFVLGEGPGWHGRIPPESCLMLNTEQLQTQWFARTFRFLSRCRAVLDLNVQSAAGLRQLGIRSYFLPIGYVEGHPLFDEPVALPDLPALESLADDVRQHRGGPEDEWHERPLDLLFIGALSPRRERLLGRLAPHLAAYRSFLHVPRPTAPFVVGKTASLDTSAALGLAQRSRVVLNIHQDEAAYFEWHRIVLHGIWQGAVVLSEPSFRVPGLVPGEHYLECDSEEMVELLTWLLETDEGRRRAEEIRRAALDRFRDRFELPSILGRLLTELGEL